MIHEDIAEVEENLTDNVSTNHNSTTNVLEEMSNFVFTSKYARYDKKKKRRETWEEAIDRVMNMHLKKYYYLSTEDQDEIRWAFDMVKQKRCVPSMRSMQFGGIAIEAHNARMFNCGVRHIDSLRSFAESFYLLLCGVGLGFGISKKFLSRLPDLVNGENKTGTILTYTIEDNIEGWADSVEALLMCYFKNTPYTGRKIVFDYSKIRKKGAELKTGGGKAPGYKGLKHAHIKIKELLDDIIENKQQRKLKSINAYDILMHCSDAVLSGGIRRAATATIFDETDEEMLNAKTSFIVDKVKGFYLDEDTNKWNGIVYLGKKKYNIEGMSQFDYDWLLQSNTISWFHVEPQRARSNNSVLIMKDTLTKEKLTKIIEQTKMFGEPGFVFADHKDQLFNPCITKDTLITTHIGDLGILEVLERLNEDEVLFALTYNQTTELLEYKQIFYGEKTRENVQVITIITDKDILRVTPNHKVYTINKDWIDASDLELGDEILSIDKVGEFDSTLNYTSFEDSNVRIIKATTFNDQEIIKKLIFNKSILHIDEINYEIKISTIKNIKMSTNEDVYDISVEDNQNFFANNVLVHNCFEIGFIPVTEDGICAVQFCNLTSINGKKINSLEEFENASKAATIIGTLQAGYTDFKYLHHTAKQLTEEEALLGVSITGMMDKPKILLNGEYQKKVALQNIETNKKWAKKIEIQSAARLNALKPEGSSALVLQSASGIHPHHSHKYFRRIQANKVDNIYTHFKEFNQGHTEESLWSSTKTDDIITFPIEIPKSAIVKSDLTAIKHLEIAKNTQKNWVISGSKTEKNTKGINHNVSLTVIVKNDKFDESGNIIEKGEWEDVVNYLFENKEYFTAVSFISDSGDKDYAQAPNESVITQEDEEKFQLLLNTFKHVDYSTLKEDKDETEFQQTIACAGNQCEVVF